MVVNPYWAILASELEQAGVTVIKDNPNAFNGKWLAINRGKIGVLHIHFYQLFYADRNGKVKPSRVLKFLINLIYSRILGYRVVYTVHNLEPTYWLEPKWLDQLGHATLIHLADRLIVHCQEVKRIIANKYNRKQVVFVMPHPNYIDYYQNYIIKEKAREKLALTEKGLFVFTFLGGIRPNKGIENLIRAFRKLKNTNYHLMIAGAVNKPASYAQYLQALAGVDKRISFHFKWIADDEIQVYLNATDIVVLPFTKIFVSGSATLALSFGRPVIAPRMGCLPDIIEPDAGWLYAPGDVDSLSRNMQEAAKLNLNPTNESAKKKVMPFSQKDFCKRTQQVYWN